MYQNLPSPGEIFSAYDDGNPVGTTDSNKTWVDAISSYANINDGTLTLLYMDGILADSVSDASIDFSGADGEMRLGEFASDISAAYIFSRALSAEEINSLHVDPYQFLIPA